MRKIYVASSWRNTYQPEIVDLLRAAGHEVYDFKHPLPDNEGFHWSEISREWLNWSPDKFVEAVTTHPIAAAGFKLDKDALDWCDTCVCVLPCGRSAHLELGYAVGQGKFTVVLLYPEKFEPELMYLLCHKLVTNTEELLNTLK